MAAKKKAMKKAKPAVKKKSIKPSKPAKKKAVKVVKPFKVKAVKIVKPSKVKSVKVVKKPIKAKKAVKKYVSYKTIVEPEGYIPPKSYKFLGYCPECEGLVSESDIPEGKSRVVDCNRCHVRTRINRLLLEISSTESSRRDHTERIKHIEEHYAPTITQPSDVPEELLPDMNDQV